MADRKISKVLLGIGMTEIRVSVLSIVLYFWPRNLFVKREKVLFGCQKENG